MLSYNYGSGTVIVSSLYSDWGYSRNQTSNQERILIRDMVTWAKSDREIVEVEPGEEVQCKISNVKLAMQNEVKIKVYDPNKILLTAYSLPLTATFTYQTYGTSTLGIYTVTSETEGTETAVLWFGVRKELTVGDYKLGDYQIWVNAPESVVKGSEVVYTVYLKNNTDKPIENRTIAVCGHEQGGAWWRYYGSITPVNIPAKSQGSFIFKTTLNYSTSMYFGLLREGLENNTSPNIALYGIIYCEKGVWITNPQVDVKVKTDRNLYTKGDKVYIDISLQNLISNTYDASLNLKVIGPLNDTLFSEEKNMTITPGIKTETFEFDLLEDAIEGYYTIKVEVIRGERIGFGSAYFELLRSFLFFKPSIPDTFRKGTNTISFTIENRGSETAEYATLSYTLKNPEKNELQKETFPIGSLTVEGTKTILIDLFIPELRLGIYTLDYGLTYEGRICKAAEIIPCSFIIKKSLDKPSYRAREGMRIDVEMINNGRFMEDINYRLSVPDIGFLATGTSFLSPNGTVAFSYNLSIPGSITTGLHNVMIEAILESGSLTKQTRFAIPQSDLSLSSDFKENAVTPGQVIGYAVKNSGGVDTEYSYQAGLERIWYDKGERLVKALFKFSGTGSVLANGSSTIFIDTPIWRKEDISGGYYSLYAIATDTKTKKVSPWNRNVLVKEGIAYGLTKKDFIPGEKAILWLYNPTVKELEFEWTAKVKKGEEVMWTGTGGFTSEVNATSTISFVIPSRLKITDGDYQMVVDFKERSTGNIYQLNEKINIAGVIKMELREATASAGGNIELVFNNQGIESKSFNADIGLVDVDGIRVSSSSVTLNIANLGSSSVILSIPSYAKSGIYSLKVDCRDGFSDILSLAFDLGVSGVEAELKVSLDKPAYLPGEAVSATYTITNKAIALNEGRVKMRVIDMTPPKVAGVDIWYMGGDVFYRCIYKIYIRFSRGMTDYSSYNIKLYVEGKRVDCHYRVEGNGVWLEKDNNYIIVLIYRDEQYKITINGDLPDIYGNKLDGNGNGISEGAPIDNYERIAIAGGYSLVSSGYPMKEDGNVLWQRESGAIVTPAGGSLTGSVQIGTITPSKRCYLETALVNQAGQRLSYDITRIIFGTSSLSISLKTDKKLYRSGEMITITGIVGNRGEAAQSALLELLKGTQSILSKMVDIGANSVYSFSATTTSVSTFYLKGKIGGAESLDYVKVEKPSLAVKIEASSVVETTTAIAKVYITNPKEIDVDLGYRLIFKHSDSSFSDVKIDSGSLSIQKWTAVEIKRDFKVFGEGTISLIISGDVSGTYTKPIIFQRTKEPNLKVYGLASSIGTESYRAEVFIENNGCFKEKMNCNFFGYGILIMEPYFVATLTISLYQKLGKYPPYWVNSSMRTRLLLSGKYINKTYNFFIPGWKDGINIDSPSIVGQGTNTFYLTVKNPTLSQADINYEVYLNYDSEKNSGDRLSVGSITLPAGSATSIPFSFSILNDTRIYARIFGGSLPDLTLWYPLNNLVGWPYKNFKDIKFGEKIDLSLSSNPIYPSGFVEIPFTIKNDGELSSEFDVEFGLERLATETQRTQRGKVRS